MSWIMDLLGLVDHMPSKDLDAAILYNPPESRMEMGLNPQGDRGLI